MAQPSSRDLAQAAWAAAADLIDLQLSPLGLAAMDAMDLQPGQVILDIGCGAGQTLIQLAARVGSAGRVIGVDIAPRLLALAHARAAGLSNITLIQHDAATLDLPDASIDGLFSRFGVMAFADATAAFRNFHRMMKPAARLGFVCWRSLEENELDYLPLRAAGLDIAVDRTSFSFENADHIAAVLASAGFHGIGAKALDKRVSSGDLEAMLTVLTKVGPLGKILRETPALRASAEPKVRAALAAASDGHHVSLGAATWIVTATA